MKNFGMIGRNNTRPGQGTTQISRICTNRFRCEVATKQGVCVGRAGSPLHAARSHARTARTECRALPDDASVMRFVTIRLIRVLNLGMSQTNDDPLAIGIIGGSRLYSMA